MLIAQPLLPYALGFAAGAMLIPESQLNGNEGSATLGFLVGFLLMMILYFRLG
ncbi:MAG TPA: hypothetical protein VJ350_06195 [Methanoregula sp.]|nr:hypothetical protein [Methanoregula sp.]